MADTPEVTAVVEFLRHCLPFSELPSEQQLSVARSLQVIYWTRGHRLTVGGESLDLYLIRSGALELRDVDGELLDRLGEGESLHLGLLAEDMPGALILALEDCLLYRLPADALRRLAAAERNFDLFFQRQRSRQLPHVPIVNNVQSVLTQTLADVLSRAPVTIESHCSVADAATCMNRENISSLLVVEQRHLVGILTDRDLRGRVLAAGLPTSVSVAEVMTSPVVTLPPQATLFDVQQLMAEHAVHHVPVIEQGKPLGMITGSDLIRSRQYDPVHLIQHLARQESVERIALSLEGLPRLLLQWVDAGAHAYQLSRILTTITDAVTRRLLALAEAELGPPPVPYAWLALGSQGRREQALGGDQDNALVLDDRYRPEHGRYFAELARRVCDGLNRCGWFYCPGGIMATTGEWRQPLEVWRSTVRGWTQASTPDAVMRVSIFFDIRRVAGDVDLARSLQLSMLQGARGNTTFLAALTWNALKHTPPLGFFRRFVLERSGEHREELDLKYRGIIPLVDLVRVHALANGLPAVSTQERIQALVELGAFTEQVGRNLLDAQEVVALLRFEHQSAQISAGIEPDNYLNPHQLTALKREQLREAFRAIHDAQRVLALHYTQGIVS